MATNADPAVDDSKPVTEDDLKDLKYPNGDVDPPANPAEDEPPAGDDPEADPANPPDDDDQIVPPAPDEDTPPAGDTPPETPPAFVKKFENIKGDTPEEYAAGLEAAYENSTGEAIRLKTELEKLQQAPPTTPPAEAPPADPNAPDPAPAATANPTDLYVQQQLDKEIVTAFDHTKKEFPGVNDPAVYTQFAQKVQTFSKTILETEKRLASPAELYTMAALSLGLERHEVKPDDAEKLAMAAKNGAATPSAPAAPSKPKAAGPNISEAQMAVSRKMYPGKSDEDIIKELTPYQPK